MDAITSMASFHYIMSKFADLLIKVKQRMDKLRYETREIVDELSGEDNLEQYTVNTNYQTEANLKSIIDVAILELERKLSALDTSCNKSWLRMFLYVSNYSSTAPNIEKGHEEMKRNVISMHNVMLPDYTQDDFDPTEKYFFNEYSLADASKQMVYPRSCRRPRELSEEEKFCLNAER